MATLLTILVVLGTVGVVAASGHLLSPFTQAELDNNWEEDRQFPSGGVESVSALGRDNVAQLGIDSDATHPENIFRRTEGIKTTPVQDFGTFVRVDLFIDPDWEDKAVRAGFWVVGDNGEGGRDNLFGIIEFVNNEPCPPENCSNQDNITDHEGFRIWDSEVPGGWKEDLETPFSYGQWVTLAIELDPAAQEYTYYLNGEQVGTATGGKHFIRELFLNSYNYGLDEFPNLSSDGYAAHWHHGLEDPEVRADCMRDGWQDFGFRNQGQCIRFVETGQDSR